jgi:hypothetical protein
MSRNSIAKDESPTSMREALMRTQIRVEGLATISLIRGIQTAEHTNNIAYRTIKIFMFNENGRVNSLLFIFININTVAIKYAVALTIIDAVYTPLILSGVPPHKASAPSPARRPST